MGSTMSLPHVWGTLTNRRARRARSHEPQRPTLPWRRLPLRILSAEDRLPPGRSPLEVYLSNRDPVAVTLRLNGGNVQVIPTAEPGAAPLAARPLAEVSAVRIVGDP